jgi:hypothetical protein
VQFNPEQQTLFNLVTSLDFSKLLLTGEAGTGKTAVLCKAVSELVRKGQNGLILCAPTHLARLNLISKLDQDVAHMVETSTVASLLLKFGIDSDDGTVQFTSGKLDRINKYSIVALDECSMLSEQDYELLMSSRAKIIFLGDYAQLPPVMAKSAERKMNNHADTGNLRVVRLVEQMRQPGVIHIAAEKNRTRAWFPEESEKGDRGESITVHTDEEELIKIMIKELINDKRGYAGTYHHRYIAYRNNNIREVGKRVRDKVLLHYFGFDPNTVPFIQGEYVMMRENKTSIGFNGELVEIVRVAKDRKFKSLNPYLWDSYELTVKGSLGTGLIRTIPPCSQKVMDDYIEKLQSKLKKFQIDKDLDSASDTLVKIKKIRSYWTITQYPYAVTTHKSQGMTIENVYLNTTSFVSAPNKRALLYVGISRASVNLHTVRVTGDAALDSAYVNGRYKQAKLAYTCLTGKPFRNVLGFSTRTLTGKDLVTGYIESVVEDLKQ